MAETIVATGRNTCLFHILCYSMLFLLTYLVIFLERSWKPRFLFVSIEIVQYGKKHLFQNNIYFRKIMIRRCQQQKSTTRLIKRKKNLLKPIRKSPKPIKNNKKSPSYSLFALSFKLFGIEGADSNRHSDVVRIGHMLDLTQQFRVASRNIRNGKKKLKKTWWRCLRWNSDIQYISVHDLMLFYYIFFAQLFVLLSSKKQNKSMSSAPRLSRAEAFSATQHRLVQMSRVAVHWQAMSGELLVMHVRQTKSLKTHRFVPKSRHPPLIYGVTGGSWHHGTTSFDICDRLWCPGSSHQDLSFRSHQVNKMKSYDTERIIVFQFS